MKGGGIDIVARLPDGRFQARALGRDFSLTLPQAAQVSGLSPQAFESRMTQATRDSLAAPRQAGGAVTAAAMLVLPILPSTMVFITGACVFPFPVPAILTDGHATIGHNPGTIG